MKRIEWFEINANDSENSCWIVISDKVYDVTNFIHNHVLFFILVKFNKL
jgi:cytochrome b involved in lipid metabolism